ncbi:MAG: response regulator [Pleurocapsa sp. SU_196_0]|nr:response regulator [Pleurocapsa sp. SU_196_0]
MLSEFQSAVKTMLERVSQSSDTVPLSELEAGARDLQTIAAQHGATGLERLSKRLSSLARTAHEMSAPVSVSVLDRTFKALERADPFEDVAKLENALERLEEDAFLYTPPVGALILEPTPVVEPTREERPGGIRRVLSVDDSSLVRSALRRIFTEAGAGIEEARGGAEALERFKEIGKYDLVLLDVNMPDMTGIELLPHLRERSTEVAVVMLTSEDDVKTAIAAIQQGADGYIQKQDLPLEGDRSAFFHALEQAREARAGIVARQQLESLKADFYSMVTHDLKTPRTSFNSRWNRSVTPATSAITNAAPSKSRAAPRRTCCASSWNIWITPVSTPDTSTSSLSRRTSPNSCGTALNVRNCSPRDAPRR